MRKRANVFYVLEKYNVCVCVCVCVCVLKTSAFLPVRLNAFSVALNELCVSTALCPPSQGPEA